MHPDERAFLAAICAEPADDTVQLVFAEAEKTRDRVAAAAAAVIKLLGLHKLIKGLQEAGDVDEYLAAVMARRAARAGEIAEGAKK